MGIKIITTNRRAGHDFSFFDKFEAGISLQGTEVKALRLGKANLSDGWVDVSQGEAILRDVQITPYTHGNVFNHAEKRPRRLLLHAHEIVKLRQHVEEKGMSIIPLKLYFKESLAKVEIALAKGKKQHDKRESVKTRDASRDMARAMRKSIAVMLMLGAGSGLANPYPDPKAVPQDPPPSKQDILEIQKGLRDADLSDEDLNDAIDVLRVRLDWHQDSDKFTLENAVIEPSGTPALLARAQSKDRLGSYQGLLIDAATKETIAYDSIGTGQEYRRLTRALTFRFPAPKRNVILKVLAENPLHGKMEEVLSAAIQSDELERIDSDALRPSDFEAKVLKEATASPKLIVNFYAEGYRSGGSASFFADAMKGARALQNSAFPMVDHFEMRAIFAGSNTKLGTAKDLGLPVAERQSFLGLYFPYWRNFGRWYHVVYPTREERFRRGLASAPYDYAISLIDDSEYWGVGNYRELTSIPSRADAFTYLLLHEFGHFFGLNEEYEGGGPTELAFAPKITEPWSQNITFATKREHIKWNALIDPSTSVPTPLSEWRRQPIKIGSYEGGYATTPKPGKVFKPVAQSCTMESGSKFCPVCDAAIKERIKFDLGIL